MNRLEGKRAVVTGAARGIGLAVAKAFASEGAVVLLTDIREQELRDAATAMGQPHELLDVRSEDAWRAAMAHMQNAYGGLDVLVNNAGVSGFEAAEPPTQDPEHAELEHWRSILRTNLDGVFLGCKHGIRAMRSCGSNAASIINIGSRSGVVGVPGASAYAASKAAVRNHTKSVTLYCAEQRLPIRCNVVQPAAILTPMWEPMLGEGPEREESIRAFTADCPLRRFGNPQEVAGLIVHLASDESTYTTGAEFTIDGGILAGGSSRA